MKINTITGAASEVKSTGAIGYESLAISVPQGCATAGIGETAEFTVESRFADGNNITPIRFNIQCNTGLPLQQSVTTIPDEGFGGAFEVKFVVENIAGGELDCTVWEDTPEGYRAEYACQANNSCGTNDTAGPCTFENVREGENNLCLIENFVEPVEFTVNKQWLYEREDYAIDSEVKIDLQCLNVVGGDGTFDRGNMRWSWLFTGDTDSHTAILQPDFAGNTKCSALEQVYSSAIESDQGCSSSDPVMLGDDPHQCTVTNTVFFEGIPTLSQYGMILFASLMLLTGLIATRRL